MPTLAPTRAPHTITVRTPGTTMPIQRSQPTIDDHCWVPAAPFRAHVSYLMRTTASPWPVIAYQASAPLGTIRTLLFGRHGRLRPKIPRAVASNLLRIHPEDLMWVRVEEVCAEETGARIRLLRSKGVDWDTLARILHLDTATCQAIAHGEVISCLAMVQYLAKAACEMNHLWGFDSNN